jgi:hypothetical protein
MSKTAEDVRDALFELLWGRLFVVLHRSLRFLQYKALEGLAQGATAFAKIEESIQCKLP